MPLSFVPEVGESKSAALSYLMGAGCYSRSRVPWHVCALLAVPCHSWHLRSALPTFSLFRSFIIFLIFTIVFRSHSYHICFKLRFPCLLIQCINVNVAKKGRSRLFSYVYSASNHNRHDKSSAGSCHRRCRYSRL